MIIDADVHVLETEKTFSYLSKSEEKYRPGVVQMLAGTATNIPLGSHAKNLWLIDGQMYGKHDLERIESHGMGEIAPGTLDMRDPAARLKAMDAQGVDVGVIYPSLFLATNIADSEAELALARSYNRWLVDVCAANPARLKFAAVIAPRRVAESIAEMKWARDNGACGVLMRGFEGDQTFDNPDYHPILAAAADLDFPVCVHIGHGSRTFRAIRIGSDGRPNPLATRFPAMIAFSCIMRGELHKKFPKLRFGIVEAGSSWLPSVAVMSLAARRAADRPAVVRQALKERNVYITCEDHEDFTSILPYAGDDNLVIGSDFGHPGDVAESIHVQRDFKARTDVPEHVKTRILSDNARVLYGI